MLFLLTIYFFYQLNEQIIKIPENSSSKEIRLVNKSYFSIEESIITDNHMAKSQSDSCNLLYLIITFIIVCLSILL